MTDKDKEKKHKEPAADSPETPETETAAPENAPGGEFGASAQESAPDGGQPAPADAEAPGAEPDAPADENPAAAAAAAETPEERMEALEKQCAEYKDLYLRKAADFDNYRKRMIREKQEAIDFANSNLLVDLIQVLDDFDRAISASGEQEKGTPAAAFAEGVVMIRRQMASMLENKYGLTYYPSAGEPFDPNIHEAIGRVPSADVTEPVVQEECRKGYKLKDRVIRLAQVIVKTPPEN